MVAVHKIKIQTLEFMTDKPQPVEGIGALIKLEGENISDRYINRDMHILAWPIHGWALPFGSV